MLLWQWLDLNKIWSKGDWSRRPIATLRGHSGPVNSLAFSPDGSRLASGSDDNLVRLWNTTLGRPIADLEGHSNRVWSVAFSPDGLQLASGSYDRTVRLWDAISGVLIAELEGHSDRIQCVAFSPDGLQLASGSDDHSVRLWDVKSGKPIRMLEGHTGSLQSISFSLDARTLLSQTDTELDAWDLTPESPSRIHSKSFTTSNPPSVGLPPLNWSCNGRWIQAQHPLKNDVTRICYIPPFYSPST